MTKSQKSRLIYGSTIWTAVLIAIFALVDQSSRGATASVWGTFGGIAVAVFVFWPFAELRTPASGQDEDIAALRNAAESVLRLTDKMTRGNPPSAAPADESSKDWASRISNMSDEDRAELIAAVERYEQSRPADG